MGKKRVRINKTLSCLDFRGAPLNTIALRTYNKTIKKINIFDFEQKTELNHIFLLVIKFNGLRLKQLKNINFIMIFFHSISAY